MAIDQKWVWGGIAAGGAGLAVYMYRQNKKKVAATQAAEAGYGYGYGYGYGLGQTLTNEPYGYGFGPFGLGAYGGSGAYGYGFYGAGGGTVPTQVPTQATTNAQWSQAAISALTSAGFDAQASLAALGVYLTGGNLTQDQTTIVQAALAAEGYPPVPGPNNYPPQLHTGGGGGTGQGGGTTPATMADNPPKNLRVVFMGRTGGQIQWDPVHNATHYTVYVPKINRKFDTSNTNANIGQLKPNTSYTVQVWADPTKTGGPHATRSFKTPR